MQILGGWGGAAARGVRTSRSREGSGDRERVPVEEEAGEGLVEEDAEQGPVVPGALLVEEPSARGVVPEPALAEAPGMIAGFEDPHVHDRGSMVSGDAAPITVVPPRVPMTFHLDTGAAAACWSAQATEVAFTVPTPMAEGFVQRVEVALPGRRFPLWLRVATATPVAGGYAVVGQPFALSGPSLEAWLAATG